MPPIASTRCCSTSLPRLSSMSPAGLPAPQRSQHPMLVLMGAAHGQWTAVAVGRHGHGLTSAELDRRRPIALARCRAALRCSRRETERAGSRDTTENPKRPLHVASLCSLTCVFIHYSPDPLRRSNRSLSSRADTRLDAQGCPADSRPGNFPSPEAAQHVRPPVRHTNSHPVATRLSTATREPCDDTTCAEMAGSTPASNRRPRGARRIGRCGEAEAPRATTSSRAPLRRHRGSSASSHRLVD